MKKFISLACTILLIIVSIFIYTYYTQGVKSSDLIVKVDKNKITKFSEKTILNYYKDNKNNFKTIIKYLAKNPGTFRDKSLSLENGKIIKIKKMQPVSIRKLIMKIFAANIVTEISYSDYGGTDKHGTFLIRNKYGVYQQGIKYFADKNEVKKDKTNYNYVKYYKSLDNGFFYYLYYYNKIKKADTFRKIAWNGLGKREKESIIYDWHKAIVTLENGDNRRICYMKGMKKRELVVSVCFNTNEDGLLGPIVLYIDPSTKEIVGGAIRM